MPVYTSMGELNKALKKRSKAERRRRRKHSSPPSARARSHGQDDARSAAIVPAKMERRKIEGPLNKGNGDPELVAACAQGDIVAVRALLDGGASVNQKNHFGRTGLFKAASYGYAEVCALLVERKADLFLRDAKGYTAVDWARLSRQADTAHTLEHAMATKLREFRAEFDEEERKKSLNWIWEQNAVCSAKVKEALLANDLAACVSALEDCPPRADFDEACRLNQDDRMEGQGGDSSDNRGTDGVAGDDKVTIHCSDVATRHGWTALTKAAALGDVERAAKIMAAKADVNLETKMGHTPLTWAASCGYREIVVQLNWNGANLDHVTAKERKTALMHAARKGHAEVCAYILDRLVEQAQAAVLADKVRCQAIQEILQRQALKTNLRLRLSATAKHDAREGSTRLEDSKLIDAGHSRGDSASLDGGAGNDEDHEPELSALDVAVLQNELKAALGKDWVSHLETMLSRTDRLGRSALDYAIEGSHSDVVLVLETQLQRCQEHRSRDEEELKNSRLVECVRKCGCIDRADAINYHEEVMCPLKKISCTSNCGEKMLQGELDEHLRSACSRRTVLCGNSYFGCTAKLPEFKREEHEEFHCKFRLVDCRLGCGEPLRYHQRASHEQEKCSLRVAPCVKCKEEMQVRHLKTHARKSCPFRIVSCPLNCNDSLLAKDVEHHVKYICVRPCKWCSEMIGPELKRRYHEEYLCLRRIAECGQRCGITNLVEADRLHHEAELCGNRVVQCTAGCGEWIFYGDQHNHIDPDCGDCARRLVRCPYDLANNKRVRIRSRGTWVAGSVVHWKKKKGLFKILFEQTGRSAIGRAKRDSGSSTAISWQALDNVLYYPLQGSTWSCGKFSSADVTHHINHECVLRTVKCTNGCGQKVLFKNLAAHLRKACSLRSVPCPLGCATQTSLTGQAAHLTNECPKRQIRCVCGTEVVAEQLSKHEVEDCVYTWTRCSYGCGKQVQKYLLERHLAEECPKRNVPCNLDCGLVLWAEEMHSHYTHDCLHREVPCTLGCGEGGIRFKDLAVHEKEECLLRKVACPLKCETMVSFSKLQEHLRFYCPRAKVPCPLGCGQKVLRCDLPTHESDTCARRQVVCPAGCKMWVTHDRLDAHARDACPLGVIQCPFGCGEQLRRGNLPDHELICTCRVIPCGGCFDGCQRQVRSWLIDAATAPPLIAAAAEAAEGAHKDSNKARIVSNAPKPGNASSLGSGVSNDCTTSETQTVALAGSKVLVYCETHLETALTFAAVRGDLPLLVSILDQLDASKPSRGVDFVTLNGATALIYACRGGHMQCAEALLEAGADINLETSHGSTALLEAIRAGQVGICKMLIGRRVDVDHANSQRLTPLVAARRTGLADVVSLIYAFTRLAQQQKELFQHITLGNGTAIREMLKHGAPHETNIVEKLQLKLERLRVENDEVNEAIEEIEDDAMEAEAHFAAFSHNIREKERDARKLQVVIAELQAERQRFSVEIVPFFKKQLRALQELRENHVTEVQRIYNPPLFMQKTFTALLLLLGISPAQVKDRRDMGRSFVDDWWSPARQLLSKHDFVRTVQLFNFSEVHDDIIARIRDDFVAPGGGPIAAPPEDIDLEGQDTSMSSSTAREKKVAASDTILTEEDAAFLRGDGHSRTGTATAIASTKLQKLEAKTAPLKGDSNVPRIPLPGSGAEVDPAPSPSINEQGEKRLGTADDELWGYRAGSDGYPLVEALQLYLSYVCKHREFELRKRAIDVETAALKAEQNQIMASLWPDHAAYKRAEFRHVMLSERYEDLLKRRRAIQFATQRSSQRFEVSLLLNSRTATGHTALSWASMYDNSAIIHLLCKYGSVVNYEDCVNNAAAKVLQTLFRHYSWKLHRDQWTTQNGPRYRLQEAMTWRRLRGLYKQFEFLRETGRVPLLDAFYNGSQNCVEALLARKASVSCTGFAFPSQPFPMSIPNKLQQSPVEVLAWHAPKTRPAMRGKVESMHAETKARQTKIRNLKEEIITQRAKHRHDKSQEHALMKQAAADYQSRKAAATTAREALEKHREEMFKLVLAKAAQIKMEADLKAREDTVHCLEMAARDSRRALRAAKEKYRVLRETQKAREQSTKKHLKNEKHALRKHLGTLEERVAELEPFNVLTVAQAAVAQRSTLEFVRGEGWVRRDRFQASLELAHEIWGKFDAERQGKRTVLLGLKEVHRRGELLKELNSKMSEAILANDYDAVTRYLDEGAHADYEPPHGYTALIMAAERDVKCHNKDGEVVQAVCALLDREERQAQVGRESRKLGYTALARAAHKGKTSAMEQLLRRKANPNYVTRFGPTRGTTALIVAARNGKADAVRLLLEWGADPQATDAHGVCAITAARDKNFTSACRELCFHGMCFSGRVQAAFQVAFVQNFCRWGCGRVLGADEIEEHERHDCPKAMVACPNGCDRRDIWRSRVGEHLTTQCERREVRCKFCHATMLAEMLVSHHVESCPFRTVRCLMCNEEMQERHRKAHDAEQCPFRIERCVACGLLHMHNRKKLECMETVVRCLHGCGREMRRKWISAHETKACPKRRIACKWKQGGCKEQPRADVYVYHVESECEFRLVECDWKCGAHIPVNEMENHKMSRCKRRFVWCPSGCGMKIRACDGKVHLRSECANREQECRLGCRKVLHAGDLEEHEKKKCQLRLVPCGNGCGESVQARNLAEHKESSCTKRPVPCELGCDMVLPFDKLEDHHRLFCRRRKVLCPVGCGEELIAQYTPGHMKSHCKLRFVKCTLNGGCTETFRECDREAHERYNCSCRDQGSRASPREQRGKVHGRKGT